jgi:probable aminopeptidase NPEPL1
MVSEVWYPLSLVQLLQRSVICLYHKEVRTTADTLGVSSTVIRGEDLRLQGFGGIYGVGKAALVPPALAVLSHTPEGATQTVAWVGKGIVYDTGGLSIKAKVRHFYRYMLTI